MRSVASFLSLLLFCVIANAGGPLNVAGVSWFQPGLAGTPITWANGQIAYYTDQGELSPLLSNAQADELVAEAFSQWTSIPTAAISATRAGELAEDVNGTNVTMINGVLSLPADLRTDSGRPLAIVYDADGRVFDALLGSGAGSPEMCSSNSIYAAVDKIADDAHITHALVVINGNCAKTTEQVALLRYRLVRALGQILGLDYSQLNDNVITGVPTPMFEDYAGFPVMHPLGVLCNEGGCQSNSEVPRMDDRAAISRLYPVTTENQGNFQDKQLTRDGTARISGNVRFANSDGTAGQGMQGVNVVARLVDPVTGSVSRQQGASCVSGFRFRGNAGNLITGYYDALHQRFDRFGSDDPVLEGFFDLAGLEIPAGYSSATYELSVEAVNPLYTDSASVGPYKQGAVAPSGTFTPVRLTVARGGEVVQDIAMQGSAGEPVDSFEPNSFMTPSPVPSSGTWTGSLSGYGDLDYLVFRGRANRSFTFDVAALDERGVPSTSKALPVLGLWGDVDVEEYPRMWATYFNSPQTGTTRMQAAFFSDGDYKLGIVDARGDGRPDFAYRARLLYADSVSPSRASAKGGTTLRIAGMGFTQTVRVTVGATTVTPTVVAPDAIELSSPALPDGTYSIVVDDPASGATSQMDNVLYVGAAETRLVLLSGSNPQVPVGTTAPNPICVRVQDANSADPVEGATVLVTSPASAAIAGCGQTPCSMVTDQAGLLDIWVEVKEAGPSIITASLPSGAMVQATVNGIIAPVEISVANPAIYVSSGESATVPVSAIVVVNGVPAINKTVNFLLNSGTGTIAPASAVTGPDGIATSTVNVDRIATDVNISACVAPDNAPCRTVVIHAVAPANLVLRQVSGDGQTITVGQNFVPITVRVEEATGRPVTGALVTFRVDVFRAPSETEREQHGDGIITRREQPVILRAFAVTAVSDFNGVATLGAMTAENQPVRVVVRAMAGQAEVKFVLNSTWGQSLSASSSVVSVQNSTPMLVTSSNVNRPTRSRSCTKAGCSVVSKPSVLRRGSRAFSKALSAAASR